jgi:hypothetical protein
MSSLIDYEEERVSTEYFMIKAAYPSNDWGWALQWVNKNHISLDLNVNNY